ncbi:hypothetical protein [Hyalangium minutum]|uniref:Uncharacterized protein n=1 Tax=Hyalangium minutum TaxID=394096 RepID=A0A085WAR2_9BACT|nr:hypothetical protein [Hyalangium minutum]KFE64775.1 hypothetical protein DB31_1793 [Hyalangium minutum]
MSEGFTPPPPQHDRLPSLRILAVLVGWLVLTSLSVLGMRWWEARNQPAVAAGTPAQFGEAEIANVNQRPFALEKEAPRLRAAQDSRLERYGWVDRGAGVIHVPIEQAMDQVLAQEGRGP